MKKILIINSQKSTHFLFDLFEELSGKDFSFSIRTFDTEALKKFQEKKWNNKKIWQSPDLNNFFLAKLFFLTLPILYFFSLFFLLYLKYSQKIKAIICFDTPEKLLVTFPARILNIKTVWFEYPDTNYQANKKIINRLLKINSRWAKILVLNNLGIKKLEKIKITKNINLITPGIKPANYQRQENIFDKIAETNQSAKNKKFFTIGAAADLKNDQQKLEVLFKTIKKCLEVIPHLQLIIIGDGPEKKNLNWIIKQMGIDNLIWFVSEQAKIKKWLEGFDIFVATFDTLTLRNVDITLKALAVGLPIVGQADSGLEDLVQNDKNGILIDNYDSETLAREIIRLQQNNNLINQFSKNGKQAINNVFSIQNMGKQFADIINAEKE